VPQRRAERVSHAIHREVSDLLQREVNDPRLDMATVTRVDVSHDLRYAKIHVSILGDEEQMQDGMKALRRAARFLRKELAGRLGLRFAPEIQFALDRSIEKADRVLRLLKEIEKEEPTGQ